MKTQQQADHAQKVQPGAEVFYVPTSGDGAGDKIISGKVESQSEDPTHMNSEIELTVMSKDGDKLVPKTLKWVPYSENQEPGTWHWKK